MFESEIWFRTSRSSGSGGQHVNKVSTKVELNFDVMNSKLLTSDQKQIIFSRLRNKINKEGILKIISQESRSQHENKEIVLKKFHTLVVSCFRKEKKRIKTKASSISKEKRISNKKIKSEKKALRKKIEW